MVVAAASAAVAGVVVVVVVAVVLWSVSAMSMKDTAVALRDRS